MKWNKGVLGLLLTPFIATGQDDADRFMQEIAAMPDGQATQSPVRGQLRPVHHTVLSAGIDAKLKRFPVKAGRQLTKGQLIAEFDCEIEQADNRIGQARWEVAKENLEVNQRLEQLKGISNLDLSISAAELAIAGAEVDRASSILSQCRVHAPFSGTVTEKYAQAYQYLKKGDMLIELVDTDNLEIEMVLPSINLMQYQKGAEFKVIIDETGQEVRAEVDRIVNVIDPVSQTIRIIGVLVNPPAGLMPGMSGIVAF